MCKRNKFVLSMLFIIYLNFQQIICARKEIQAESSISNEMEWITSFADKIEIESRFYIVLDTNVLVTSVNFIKKLRNMSGNGK